MNKEIEILKKFLSHSNRLNTIINYNGELLWSNRSEPFSTSVCKAFEEFIQDKEQPIESGSYILKCNETEFMSNVVNYKDIGVYVISVNDEDPLLRFLENAKIKGYMRDLDAEIRTYLSGITLSSQDFRCRIANENNKNIKDDDRHFGIVDRNCRKIMSKLTGIIKIINCIDNAYELKRVNLWTILVEFASSCRDVLKDKLEIIINTGYKLFINADSEYLILCLLSLTLLARRSNPECSAIIFKAEKIGDSISLTVSSDGNQTNERTNIHSRFERDKSNETISIEMTIVKQFCKICDATFFVADSVENKGKVFSLKFPLCNDVDKELVLCTSTSTYGCTCDKFSLYPTMLSEITDEYT